MTNRCWIGFVLGSFALLQAACAGDAGPARTEVLPKDGGDLGKAYVELAAAMKAGDKERAGRLLDPKQWHLGNKEKSWFQMFDHMERQKPAGGRRQGDRATLFLLETDGNPLEFRYMSATRADGAWHFDSPTDLGSSFSKSEIRDCKTGTVFPCGAKTAPDSVVWGTMTPHSDAPETQSHRVIDGLAVRMMDDKKQLASTLVLLSGNGINPEAVAASSDPEQVKGWLAWPVVALDIAPGGKSGKLEYYNGSSRKTLDITKGLSIESRSPGRIRGQLKTDVEKIALDLHFDLDTTSSCQVGAYRCGPDAAP